MSDTPKTDYIAKLIIHSQDEQAIAEIAGLECELGAALERIAVLKNELMTALNHGAH